jgi:hypothetical protein
LEEGSSATELQSLPQSKNGENLFLLSPFNPTKVPIILRGNFLNPFFKRKRKKTSISHLVVFAHESRERDGSAPNDDGVVPRGV